VGREKAVHLDPRGMIEKRKEMMVDYVEGNT
jgi:hypothetical protein